MIKKIYNFFNTTNSINDFELHNILMEIDSVEILLKEQSIIGLFWVTNIDKQVKFLSFLKPQIAAELLKIGLKGAPRQAMVALQLLKDKFNNLVNILKDEIFEAAQGDSIKVSVEAGTLLLQEEPEFLIQKPWFLKRLSSVAEAPLPVKERLTLIQLLCRQSNYFNYLQLEYYPERNEIIDSLLSEQQYLAVAFYTRAALNNWQPNIGEPNDLVWLLEVYLKVKNSNEEQKEKSTLKGQTEIFSLSNKLFLEAAVYEAAASGADAIIRCITGPGGEHIWPRFTDFLKDKDLAEEVLIALSRDPKALALLAEEMRLEPATFNLSHEEIVQFLSHGVLASQHCLKNTLRLCLNVALQDKKSSKLCLERLGSDKDKLYQYDRELFEQITSKS